jgi:ribose transport system permease protein
MSAPPPKAASELRQRLVKAGPSWAPGGRPLLRDRQRAPERYLSANNLRVVLAQTVIVALGAIGMTLVIVGGGIDLAVGSTIALTGVLCALAIRDGWSPILAVLASVLLGGAIGLVNGLAITRLRVVPFIATLGMLGVARGTAKWLANQTTVNPPETWVNQLASPSRPCRGWCSRRASGSRSCWRRRWPSCCGARSFGRRVFALGSSEAAARACGIDTGRLKLAVYGAAACCSASRA